jgi:hypothetical protein
MKSTTRMPASCRRLPPCCAAAPYSRRRREIQRAAASSREQAQPSTAAWRAQRVPKRHTYRERRPATHLPLARAGEAEHAFGGGRRPAGASDEQRFYKPDVLAPRTDGWGQHRRLPLPQFAQSARRVDAWTKVLGEGVGGEQGARQAAEESRTVQLPGRADQSLHRRGLQRLRRLQGSRHRLRLGAPLQGTRPGKSADRIALIVSCTASRAPRNRSCAACRVAQGSSDVT